MDKLDELQKVVNDFVKQRDWDQFHSEENLAKSISIEANELLECFQWSNDYDRQAVIEELADVVTYCLQFADKLHIDLYDIVLEKMKKNALKYPIEKCKGKSTKYDKLN